jgi:hypothetical protein
MTVAIQIFVNWNLSTVNLKNEGQTYKDSFR